MKMSKMIFLTFMCLALVLSATIVYAANSETHQAGTQEPVKEEPKSPESPESPEPADPAAPTEPTAPGQSAETAKTPETAEADEPAVPTEPTAPTEPEAQEAETEESQESSAEASEAVEDEEEEEGTPEERRTSKGLKEALRVGIKAAIKLVGVEDGFYMNDAIKILLPEKLKKADKLLRQFGGKEISEKLIKKMNRAAEKAAPLAKDIFLDAIKKIKFQDVLSLLTGKGNTATQFLRDTTSDSLKETFLPIVTDTMEEIGVLKTYNEYMGKHSSNPLVKALGVDVDICKYVTDQSIEGLFTMVEKEEEKIRKDPAARVTDILKTVFGKKKKDS